jgi:hypothetical protein
VQVQRGEQRISGSNGLALQEGDLVLTLAESAATVKWVQEATTLRLHSQAELLLVGLGQAKKLQLRSGLVSATVAKQVAGNPLLLITPNARAEVLGTRFRLNAEPAQTKLDVTSGRVQISRGDDGNGVIVERMHSAIVPPAGEVQVKPQPPNETLQEELLAHWKMEMGPDPLSIQDASGANRHLHIRSGANITLDRDSEVLVFTKKGAFAQCNTIPLPNSFSFSFWIKMDAHFEDSGLEPIIANSPAGIAKRGFRLFFTPSKGNARRGIYFETGNGQVGVQARSSDLPIQINRWHHIAVTVDRIPGRAAIYFDGVNVTSVGGIRSDFALAQPIVLGQMPTSYRHKLNGYLEEVRIYGRLLTVNEIRNLARPR